MDNQPVDINLVVENLLKQISDLSRANAILLAQTQQLTQKVQYFELKEQSKEQE